MEATILIITGDAVANNSAKISVNIQIYFDLQIHRSELDEIKAQPHKKSICYGSILTTLHFMVKTPPTLLVNKAYKTGLARKYSSRMHTARLLTVHVGTHPPGPVFGGG